MELGGIKSFTFFKLNAFVCERLLLSTLSGDFVRCNITIGDHGENVVQPPLRDEATALSVVDMQRYQKWQNH